MIEGASEDFACILTSFKDDSNGCEYEFRCFDCLGEVDGKDIQLHKNSYIISNETDTYICNYGLTNNEGQSYIELFGMHWDKGSVLLSNLDMLYKMASQELMELNNITGASGCLIGHSLKNTPIKSRRFCIKLWLFIRNYLWSLEGNPHFHWLREQFIVALSKYLLGLRSHLGYLINLPSYVYQHCANPSGNKCQQPAYHLMHTHLDLRWIHVTILYCLAKRKLSNDLTGLEVSKNNNFYKDELNKYIRLLFTELVHLALKRFEKLHASDVLKKSAFNCTCVQELWLLIQFFTDFVSKDSICQPFWTYFNELIEVVLKQRSVQGLFEDANLKNIDIGMESSHSKLFSLWLLCHLTRLHNFKQLKFGNNEIIDNYAKLECITKLLVNDEISENDMQKCLVYIEKLCLELWDPRTEPILILWEYFYRKMDSTFYIPGTTPDNLATIVKSPLALVSQVKSFLDSENNVSNSFQRFLRIIGLHLKRTSDNPKHWNKIRGRVFSKFSTVKMLSLKSIGEYHFTSLFITLALTVDISQVVNKMVEIVNELLKVEQTFSLEYMKGLMALATLLVEQKRDISQVILPIVLHLNSLDCTENLNLYKLFVESLQDILESNDCLDLGQHVFIDRWVGKYLSTTTLINDVSRILDLLLSVVSKLYRKVLIQQSQDQDIIIMIEKLWDQLHYYLNKATTQPSSPYQISDLTANLAVLFYKLNNLARFREIFDMFTCCESTNIKLLRRFLCQMIEHESIKSILIKLEKAVIKAWVRCCLICDDIKHTEMIVVTEFVSKLPEISGISGKLLNGMAGNEEPILQFFTALQCNYISAQNINEKQALREKVYRYMDGIELWVRTILIPPKSSDQVERVYFVIGNMFCLISPLLYVKSKPSSLLQNLTDVLLLPVSVHNPDLKLHPSVMSGIRKTLHLYIEGLIKLDPESDNYVSRILRELIMVYLPRCVQPGLHSGTGMSFKLITEFNFFDAVMKATVLRTVCNHFIKRKSRKPQLHTLNALVFIRELIQIHCKNDEVIIQMITHTMDHIFDIIMLYEERSPEVNVANSILKIILGNTIVNTIDIAEKCLIQALSSLCKDHLAWSSRQLFDLMARISTQAPQLVNKFMPLFYEHIKEVEDKRGVGYDKSLRLGLDRIQMKLRL